MARSRVDLGTLLRETTEVENVYFQPENGFKLQYPCIVYNRDGSNTQHANNHPYAIRKRYLITAIFRDPDSPIPDRIEWLPEVSLQQVFTRSNLYHYIYNILF